MKKVFLILTLLVSLTLAQTRVGTTIDGTVLPQGIRWQSLSANGFSYNFPTGLSQISGSNPSTINNFKTMAVGLSYQYNTNIKDAFISDFSYKNSYIGLPQSIAIIYPFEKKLTLGLSAAQKYNGIMKSPDMIVRTVENPNGTGETFSSSSQTNVYSFSAILAYDLSEIFPGVSTGLRYNNDNFWINSKIWHSEANGSGSSSSFSTGVSYNTQTEHGQIEFSGYYEKGVDINGNIKYKGIDIIQSIDIDPEKNGNFQSTNLEPESWKVVVLLPNRWHFGANFISESDRFLIDLAYIDWESTGAFKNNLEFSASYGHPYSDQLLLFYGIFVTNRKFESSTSSLNSLNGMSATFLTFGAQTVLNDINLDFVIADSHLFSNKWRKQTIFKIALGKSF